MGKLIILKDSKQKDALCKVFRVKKPSISLALNFVQNTEKDIKIRLAAMKNGGKLLREVENWNINDLKNK